MPKRKRFEIQGQPRFITCSCQGRLQLFDNHTIKEVFVQELAKTQQSLDFDLHAWVVMPEHIHLLLTPQLPHTHVSTILKDLKSRTASRIFKRWYQLNAPILSRLRDNKGKAHFWLAGGGYDRNLYTAHEYQEKLAYIHCNPVKRGLVESANHWQWSSATAYANRQFDQPLRISPVST